MKHCRHILFFCLLLASRAWAQSGVVAAGGGVSSASGSLDVSYGQAVCLYAASSAYYDGQGLQQPYNAPPPDCPAIRDTLPLQEICQGYPLSVADFLLTADSTRAPGLHYFQRRYTSAQGCDSIVSLPLRVLPSATSQQSVQADSIYSWRGIEYDQSGDYSDTLPAAAANGCDSIVTLHLIVIGQGLRPHIYCFDNRLLMVDHYPAGEGTDRVDFPAYRWFRDNALLPLATADNYYDLQNGRYYELSGCFYVEVPMEGYPDRWLRSNTICLYAKHGPARSFALNPNPVAAGGVVSVEVDETLIGASFDLYDMQGRRLLEATVSERYFDLPIALPSGSYVAVIRNASAEAFTRKLVVQ